MTAARITAHAVALSACAASLVQCVCDDIDDCHDNHGDLDDVNTAFLDDAIRKLNQLKAMIKAA